MLEWLRGKRKRRRQVPLYSGLRETPNRGIPLELQEQEASQNFSEKSDLIERQLLEPSQLPSAEQPLFTLFISPDRQGLITAPLPDGTQCLPIFSSPVRAADYKEIALEQGPDSHFLVSNAVELMNVLGDLESVAITKFMLDCCPRCGNVVVFGSESMKAAQDVLVVWAIVRSTMLARADLYHAFALDSARAGQFDVARDVALETLGHVSLEDARPHFLLGQIGVATGDRTLLQEARAFLRFLHSDEWERKLGEIERTGSTDFG